MKKNLLKLQLLAVVFLSTILSTHLSAQTSKELSSEKSFKYSNLINRYWFLDGGIKMDMANFPKYTKHSMYIGIGENPSVSDDKGNFLFATNGREVYSKGSIATVKNSKNLHGGIFSNQSLILPLDLRRTGGYRKAKMYYIFTLPWKRVQDSPILTDKKISYSMVQFIDDRSTGKWESEVYMKNTTLKDEYGKPFKYATEAITSVRTSDGRGYWVLIPNGNKLYSYKLDKRGLRNKPVVSSLGLDPMLKRGGFIKASNELEGDFFGGSNLVVVGHSERLDKGVSYEGKTLMVVKSFDNKTGRFTDSFEMPIFLKDYDSSWSDLAVNAEFSSNSEVLYVGAESWSSLYAVNLKWFYGTRVVYSEPNCSGCIDGVSKAIDGSIYVSVSKDKGGELIRVTNQNSFLDSGYESAFRYYEKPLRGLPQYVTPLKNKWFRESGRAEANIEGEELAIYPNPVKDKLQVSSKNGLTSLKLLSVENREVGSVYGITSKEYTYDMSNLSSGVYILVATTNDGEVITKKVRKD